jgi:anti-anti-sigma factor
VGGNVNIGPRFSAQVTHQDGSVVVRVTGDLDLVSAPRLQTSVEDLMSGQLHAFTIDIGGLEFVDVAGLRALAAAGRTVVNANAQYRLTGVSDHVLRIIRLAEFDDVEQACQATSID